MTAVILYKPEVAENVGFVARIMANFGFGELVLVEPCDLGGAKNTAKHAYGVVQNARVYSTIPWDSYDFVVGTTGLASRTRVALTPSQLASRPARQTALLFGPEGSGLDAKTLSKCDAVVTIPTTAAYSSMNLSHAVAIILYELSKQEAIAPTGAAASVRAAERAFINHLSELHYERREVQRAARALKAILGRSFATPGEIGALIRAFKRKRKNKK